MFDGTNVRLEAIAKSIVTMLHKDDYNAGMHFHEVKSKLNKEEWVNLIKLLEKEITEDRIDRLLTIFENWNASMSNPKLRVIIRKDMNFTIKHSNPDQIIRLVESGILKSTDCHDEYRIKIREDSLGVDPARDVLWNEKDGVFGRGISSTGSGLMNLEMLEMKYKKKEDIPNLSRLETHGMQLKRLLERFEELMEKINKK